MGGKRGNETAQMSKEEYEAHEARRTSDGDGVVTQGFTRASAEVLQQRRVVRARRPLARPSTTTAVQDETCNGTSNPFAKLGSTTTTTLRPPTFQFGTSTTTTTSSTPTDPPRPSFASLIQKVTQSSPNDQKKEAAEDTGSNDAKETTNTTEPNDAATATTTKTVHTKDSDITPQDNTPQDNTSQSKPVETKAPHENVDALVTAPSTNAAEGGEEKAIATSTSDVKETTNSLESPSTTTPAVDAKDDSKGEPPSEDRSPAKLEKPKDTDEEKK